MAEPVLSVQGLVKSFGAMRATDDVSLDLRPGEIHALIGPNGAGKSTLIHLICGTLPPDAGRIHLAGADITDLSAAERVRRGLGRTFQVSCVLPDFSALRNVMLAVQARRGSSFRFLKPVMRDEGLRSAARAALARVGLAARADTPAAALSHGERRQLEIALAIARGSRAFLLDEPMAGMGPEGSKALTRFLDGLRADAPILLVEHDMDAVFALADRVSVLVGGRLLLTGSVDEVRRDPAVRAAYLGET